VVDAGLLWRNLALVLATSVLPFPTSALGLAFQQGTRRDETAALILYAAVAASVSATWFEVFDYLSRNPRLLEADTSPSFSAANADGRWSELFFTVSPRRLRIGLRWRGWPFWLRCLCSMASHSRVK